MNSSRDLRAERELPGGVIDFIKSAPKTSNPMDVMRTAVSMLGLYDPRDPRGSDARD